jgi:hypothetical protein
VVPKNVDTKVRPPAAYAYATPPRPELNEKVYVEENEVSGAQMPAPSCTATQSGMPEAAQNGHEMEVPPATVSTNVVTAAATPVPLPRMVMVYAPLGTWAPADSVSVCVSPDAVGTGAENVPDTPVGGLSSARSRARCTRYASR